MDSAGAVAMDMTEATHKVSFHAVTRYMHRILDVRVDWTVPPLSAREIAEAHCLTAETTIDAVRALVWTPAVQLAASTGISMVQTRRFGARLSKDGVVTTITNPPVRKPRKRVQERSRKEDRRVLRKLQRRYKGRPSQPAAAPDEVAT